MPNQITHHLCGLEAIKLIENKECIKLINKYRSVFNLGLQGPDFLFYYGIMPWSGKVSSPEIGHNMHVAKVNQVFSGFINYILKQNEPVKAILTVYLMGYLSHNCLDSICHPYIFYRSGFKTNAREKENRFIYYHRRFETAVDVLLCKMFLDKKVYQLKHHRLTEITPVEQDIIGHMYENIIKSVFNSNVPKNKIKRAIKDMILVEKILWDPHRIKKKVVASLDYLIFGYPLFSSLIFPHEITDGLDYLNLNHREWYLPFDKSKKSNESFLDLFSEASKRTQNFCEVLFSCIYYNKPSITTALNLFGNNSFTSGIDCDMPAEFRYYDNIFESTKGKK